MPGLIFDCFFVWIFRHPPNQSENIRVTTSRFAVDFDAKEAEMEDRKKNLNGGSGPGLPRVNKLGADIGDSARASQMLSES